MHETDCLNLLAIFEDFLSLSTEESFEDASIFYQRNKAILEENSILNCICNLAKVRPFALNLFAKFTIDNNIKSFPIFLNDFTFYLHKKGFIKQEEIKDYKETGKSIDSMEEPFSDDSIWYCVYNDELQDMARIINLSDDDEKNHKIHVGLETLNIVEFAAFCGSIDIIKYLILNGYEINEVTADAAAKGGNEEIIQLIADNDVSFENCLFAAILYHRNDIADWISQFYKCNLVSVSYCIRASNTRIILGISEGKYVDDFDIIEPSIYAACLEGNLLFAKYIITKNGVVSAKTQKNSTPLHAASMKGYNRIVEWLLDSGAYIDPIDNEGKTPLFLAIQYSNNDVVETLMKNGANAHKKNNEGIEALDFAKKLNNTIACKIIERELDRHRKDGKHQ